MASGLAFLNVQDHTVVVVCVSVEPAIPYFYLTVTGLLLISLTVLELASAPAAVILVAPKMSSPTTGFERDMSNADSGFDGMR